MGHALVEVSEATLSGFSTLGIQYVLEARVTSKPCLVVRDQRAQVWVIEVLELFINLLIVNDHLSLNSR